VRAHELPPVPGSVHKKKRLGRGNASGHGTYSTRGIKGQQSRSGPDLRIGFEGGQIPLVRALSRKRGFNNRFRIEYEAINVSELAKLPAGTQVTSESLRAAGIVKSATRPVKILGDGELEVKLAVAVEKISAGARAKIEAAGGTATALIAPKEKAVREDKKPAAAEAPAREREARAPSAESAPAEAPAAEARAKAASAEEAPAAEAATADAPAAAEVAPARGRGTRAPRSEAPAEEAPAAEAAPVADAETEEPAADAKPARRPRASRAKPKATTDNDTTET
jgi:large subunit ribosomal protein L15